MPQTSREQVENVLRGLIDPHLNQDPLSAGCVQDIRIDQNSVEVDVRLGYAANQFKTGWAQMLQMQLEQLDGVSDAKVTVDWTVPAQAGMAGHDVLSQVKNVIAVASGKGGVGKSTTAANLALALAREGAKVGVLDADIYGPSQGIMFGVAPGTRPGVKDEKFFVPVEAMGVKVMSMAFLTDDETPMVWRGPMASGALLQMLTQTAWGELDYLVVDMPPGTGDIQLTLSQKAAVAGALIVTTPQDIALLDAKKGIEMFRKVNIPVLGVVENMAMHVCSSCGHIEHIFGEGGGGRLADNYEVDLLASLPLSMDIRKQCDGGKPTANADPESQIAMIYQQLARTVGARLSIAAHAGTVMPEIQIG